MNEITHHIQKSILRKLTRQESARYSEMRPKNTDSNLYSYHLKKLLSEGLILKNGNLYSLSPHGLNYVERVNLEGFNIRVQPKITTRIIVKSFEDKYFLTKRTKQPLIGMWGFVSGKIHLDDDRISKAAQRELYEKTKLATNKLEHIGNYYAKITADNEVISNTFSHVFLLRARESDLEENEFQQWFSLDDLKQLDLIPDTLDLIYLSQTSSGDFFAELEYEI